MPKTLLPPSRPQQARAATQQLLTRAGVTDPVALVGIRGYYRDTMGAAGVNDRGIYDDALFVISPEAYVSFNANTDPTVARPGMAVLKTGVWRYKRGIHNRSKPPERRYPALVQAAPVTVARDQAGESTGLLGINIHRGSSTTTSSIGCQTIPPEQWASFLALVTGEMQRHGATTIPYLLTE